MDLDRIKCFVLLSAIHGFNRYYLFLDLAVIYSLPRVCKCHSSCYYSVHIVTSIDGYHAISDGGRKRVIPSLLRIPALQLFYTATRHHKVNYAQDNDQDSDNKTLAI